MFLFFLIWVILKREIILQGRILFFNVTYISEKGVDIMSNLTLKHYFLEEIERIRMEEALFQHLSEYEEELLSLDDHNLLELYNRRIVDKKLS
jgi:hypothetical protein